eukprot:TRINITY_DN4246_c0_g2_i1.p1 TRINITY_DN4246_c0_g2~~TRINITY_DN4246_c0_g2_i1.p1  ORF type:complete len:888 (+),score=167.51 TRINITY_DN4246_c0_g2_i1:2-2665(+)
MKYVIAILVLFLACLSYEVYARDYVDSMCYAAMWNSGASAQVKKIYPLKYMGPSGYYSASQYYSYGTPYGASANTPDGLEESSVAQYYFFDDDEEVSLFFYFDRYADDSGGIVTADITSEGLAGKGASITVRDDPGDSSYIWNDSDGTSSPYWKWWPCCTDGMVLGKLPQPVEKVGGVTPTFNPSDHTFCVNMKFSEQEGVTQFKVQTLTDYLENGQRTITSFSIPSVQANTLKLCYTQCNCIQNSILDANRGAFDNKAVVEGSGSSSGIGRYAAGSDCSWIIKPEINPEYVVVYFSEFIFADFSPNDFVSFSTDVNGTNVVSQFPIEGNDDLDWTTDITANLATGIGLSTFNSVKILRDTSTFESLVSFHSSATSPGAIGFTVTYVSVAQTESLSPSEVSDAGGITVVVTGRYFLDSKDLTCRIIVSGGTWDVDATYISPTSVSCLVPAKPGAAVNNAGTISVSNDGIEFHDTQAFNYISLSCALLTDCASCSASPDCGWCASITDYYGDSSCKTIPSSADPTTPPGDCPASDYTWHPSCCDRCPAYDECNGQGTCGCDQTCSCSNTSTIQYTGDSCNCSCPIDTMGSICSGHGSCNCSSSGCECDYPYTGDLCQCTVCESSERGECYGQGTCNCDGTCTCIEGFDPDTSCQCPLSCELASNGLECGGESQGECICGQCYCKEGWTSSELCDCADTCPVGSNGEVCSGPNQGSCQCDGTCSCEIGWEGPKCGQPEACFQLSCETCQDNYTIADGSILDQTYCVWCPQSGKCVHESDSNPCYAASESANETDPSVFLAPSDCPVVNIEVTDAIREPDDTVPVATAVAAIVGLVLALGIGAVLAFLGKTQTEGITNFDFTNDAMGGATQSPLFVGNTSNVSNQLYEGN